MLRKLLMTAMLVFIYEGKPSQVGAGLLITFITLMYVQRNQPFSTAQLNSMAVFSFIGQLGSQRPFARPCTAYAHLRVCTKTYICDACVRYLPVHGARALGRFHQLRRRCLVLVEARQPQGHVEVLYVYVCKCVTARMHVCVGQEDIEGGKGRGEGGDRRENPAVH